MLTAVVLIYFGIASVLEAPPLTLIVLQIIGAGAGILLLIGLWTPVAGVLAAIVKVWIAVSRVLSHSGDPWIAFIQAVLGVVLAMVGPGAWSIDARLFGRKRIDMPERSPSKGVSSALTGIVTRRPTMSDSWIVKFRIFAGHEPRGSGGRAN
jgi:putative oxidoreductase